MVHDSSDNDGNRALSTDRRTLLGSMGAAGIGSLAGCGEQQDGEPTAEQTEPQQTEPPSGGAGAPTEGFADRVLANGRIVTLDVHDMNSDPGTIAEAVAIRERRFQAIGSMDDIGPYVGSETEVVDLGGKMVVPGFVESHVHPSSALEDVNPDLFVAPGIHMSMMAERTPEATLEKMRGFMDQVTPQEDEWIFLNVNPNPDIPEVDSIIKLTRWTKRNDPVEDLQINYNHINELAPNNPMLASISGGRTPSIAENGQILRVELSQSGEPQTTTIREASA